MKNDKEKEIAIYTEDNDGTYNELVIDVYNRDYKYIYNCKKQDLGKSNKKGTKEFFVEADFFYAYYDIIKRNYSGSYLDAEDYIDEEQYRIEESKKPVIKKEEIWRAIRWELSEKELREIISFDYRYEDDYYYDFGLIIEKVHALMDSSRTINYFQKWCVLLMRCFMDKMKCKSEKLSDLFHNLGDYFDGVAFMDSTLKGEEKLKECRGIIAYLKYFNHKIENAKHRKNSDFITNDVITYVGLGFSLMDGAEALIPICIVDKKDKTINYFYVTHIDYFEEINYTFLSQAEFEDLTNIYFDDYALDTSMKIDYALHCQPHV